MQTSLNDIIYLTFLNLKTSSVITIRIRMVMAELVIKRYGIEVWYGTTAVRAELKCGTVQLRF